MVRLGALCVLLGMVGASFAEPLNAAIERRVRVRYTSVPRPSPKERRELIEVFRGQRSRAMSSRKEIPTLHSSTPPTTYPSQLTTSTTTPPTNHTSMGAFTSATGLMRNTIKRGDLSSCFSLEKHRAKIGWGSCRKDCCTIWRRLPMVLVLCSNIDIMELVSLFRI